VPGIAAPGGRTASRSEEAELEALFKSAADAQKAGKLEQAVAAYREVLRRRPQTDASAPEPGYFAPVTAKTKRSCSPSTDAWKQEPKNPAAPFQLAQTLVQLKRPKEALEPLRAAVRLAPNNPQGHAALAQLWGMLNEPQNALREWTRLAEMAPRDANAAFMSGTIAMELKRLPDAEKWLRRANQLEKRDARGPLFLGRVLAARGKNGDAERVLADGIRRFPDVIEMGTTLSDVRWAKGDKSGAISALQRVVGRVPAKLQGGAPAAQLQVALGRMLAETGKWPDATKAFRRAAQLQPRSADAHAMLAEALLRSRKPREAIAPLQRTLVLDSKRAELRLPLARALAEAGRAREAEIEYAKYVATKPNDRAPWPNMRCASNDAARLRSR
jgi:predicted Zn-dependent protease